MVHRKLDGLTRTAAANRLPSGIWTASRCAYSIGDDRPARMVELEGGSAHAGSSAVTHIAAAACGPIGRVLPPLPIDTLKRSIACASSRMDISQRLRT